MSRSASDWFWEPSWFWLASTSERYVPRELTQWLWMRRLTWIHPLDKDYDYRSLSLGISMHGARGQQANRPDDRSSNRVK
ncbi:MAG TPA: hypothetical protein VJN19_06825 [Propionibacteriaceae bacterium]|nr:hypothetical protein [Propionibacteriaceae bacterium]